VLLFLLRATPAVAVMVGEQDMPRMASHMVFAGILVAKVMFLANAPSTFSNGSSDKDKPSKGGEK
jgi:hypothetical protein